MVHVVAECFPSDQNPVDSSKYFKETINQNIEVASGVPGRTSLLIFCSLAMKQLQNSEKTMSTQWINHYTFCGRELKNCKFETNITTDGNYETVRETERIEPQNQLIEIGDETILDDR
ncbi:hypothetical protein JTB14_032198 [Gonioctena quinquepunctata]|nr:hypothetical protein JTB14_032198 [Gonioctena quinquepunctata]